MAQRRAEFPHLPPGRPAGAQTLRNRSERTLWAPFVGLVGTAMFAAGIWLAAGGRGARFDRQEELFGGLLFAAMGLLCVYGGLVMWDRGRPQRHPRLRGTNPLVHGEPPRRGEEIRVTVSGLPAGVEGLEVGFACDERYDIEVRSYVKGSTVASRQTREAIVHEEWQQVAAGDGEQTVSFLVPLGAPYSYEGSCVSYAWRVSARAGARLRVDARHDEPIWVEP